MPISITDLISTYIPTDFVARIYDKAKELKIPTTAFEPGDPTRTTFALLGEVAAQSFGVASSLGGRNSSPGGGGDPIGADGLLVTFVLGGFLKFASTVTPDPSVARADGTFPSVGNGFLDVVASDLFNVTRSGSVNGNGGLSVTSNADLVTACIAKITPLGPLFTVPPAGSSSSTNLDPYVYFGTDPTVGGAYAGVALSAPMTRGQALIAPGLVILYLANAAGVPSATDMQREHDFLQQTAVPNAITLLVRPAIGVNVTASLTVYVPTQYAAQATADVQAAVVSYYSSVPVGGAPGVGAGFGVPRDAMIGSLFKQVPYVQDIENMLLNGAAADVVFGAGRIPLAIPSALVTVVATG
jgi:hypothetical protein